MKIKKVEVKNFRNFHGRHSFNLDKDITILYGENGHGKSTFFDAIEWCLTNEIERFRAQDGEIEFNNSDCVNNNAKEELEPECYVSIYYNNYKLIRKYNITTNNTSFNLYEIKKSTEKLLMSGQKNVEKELYKYKGDQQNIKTSLMKKSYVLSQDQIMNFIRSNPRERFDSLASIMGINKATDYIDNLKTTNSFIQSTYEELKVEYESNNQLINSHIESREEYNELQDTIVELNANLQILNIDSISKELRLEVINKEMKKMSQKIIKNTELIGVLKKIPDEFKTYDDLKKREADIENEYKLKINLITRSEERKDTTKREINDIELILNKINKDKALLSESEKKRKVIIKIHEEINKKELGKQTIEELQDKLNNYQKRLQEIDNTLLYIDIFKDAEKDFIKIPIKIKEYEGKNKLLSRKIRNRKKALSHVDKWLNKNNASASLQGLIQYLKGISEYVENNDVEGNCPVCSSHVGADLDKKIHHNILNHTSKITKLELQILRAYELQGEVQKELNDLQQNKHKIEWNSKEANQKLENVTMIIRNASQNKQLDFNLLSKNKNEIIETRTAKTRKVEEIENIIDKKIKVKTLKNEYKLLLDNLKLKKNEGTIESEIEYKNKRYNRKIERLDKLIDKSNKDVVKINQIKKEVSVYIANVYNFKDSINSNDIFSVTINEVLKDNEFLKNEYSLMDQIKELDIKKNGNKERLKKLIKYEEKEKGIKKDIKLWYDKKVELEEYIKNLTIEVGNQAMDFLNHPHSKIQQYYRYLNPTPTTNGDIRFITETSNETKRGLTIAIPYKNNDEDQLMNARYTLSSAQLNTLAIAIFLVANDSQDIGIFDFVAIDDPIQNMDDVNQYTMCDILGDIDKQLLFSTHNLDFLKLFIKKNDYKKEEIRVYFLETPNLVEGRIKELTF